MMIAVDLMTYKYLKQKASPFVQIVVVCEKLQHKRKQSVQGRTIGERMRKSNQASVNLKFPCENKLKSKKQNKSRTQKTQNISLLLLLIKLTQKLSLGGFFFFT